MSRITSGIPAGAIARTMVYPTVGELAADPLYSHLIDIANELSKSKEIAINYGTTFPGAASASEPPRAPGDLFYVSAPSNAEGLYVYTGSTWIQAQKFYVDADGTSTPGPLEFPPKTLSGFDAYNTPDAGYAQVGLTVSGVGTRAAQIAIGWNFEENAPGDGLRYRVNDDTGDNTKWGPWTTVLDTNSVKLKDYIVRTGDTMTGRLVVPPGLDGGIGFPLDPYGGGGDSASMTYESANGGEKTRLRFRVTNDAGNTASDDKAEFIVPDNASLLINNNPVWNAGYQGPGTGLDADLLDGQHGSYYMNYANLTNKFYDFGNTNIKSPGPMDFPRQSVTGFDAYTALDFGRSYEIGLTIAGASAPGAQVSFNWNYEEGSPVGSMRYRVNDDTTDQNNWGPWATVIDKDYADANYAPKTGGLDADLIGVPPGTISYHASPVPPAGWLIADGSLISTTTYADLFSAIGYTHGGGGSVFALPDLRGEFIRGFSGGRNTDIGRVFGSHQSDDFAAHNHPIETVNDLENTNLGYISESSGRVDYAAYRISTGLTGGTETRPRNVALLPIIKYSAVTGKTLSLNVNTVQLPAQAGNAGKALKTNGTSVYWDALPDLSSVVLKTGSAMSGYLDIPSPVSPSNAANKQYVDAAVAQAGFTQSFAYSGYTRMPNGLIIQWGSWAYTGNVNFPITFPNAVFSIVTSGATYAGSSANIINNSTFFGYPLVSPSSGDNGSTATVDTTYYIAIGY